MSFSVFIRTSFFKCAVSAVMSNNSINSSKRTTTDRPESVDNRPAKKIHRLNDSEKFKVKLVNIRPLERTKTH